MGCPKFVSVLLCALILPNPICRGGVWTTNDEARALNEGRGRLSSPVQATPRGNGKIWTEDETQAKITVQGRIRHVTPDSGVQVPQFEGRTQDGATFHESRAINQGRGKIWTKGDETRAKSTGQGRIRYVTPDSGKPQFDGRIEDAGAQNPKIDGRTQAELDYLEYLRAEQLENDAKIKDSAAENARFGAKKPQFGGRTQAELDYLEYLRAEQPENDAKVSDSSAENARFDPTQDAGDQYLDIAIAQYLREYLRAEQLEKDANVKDSAAENTRFDGRTQDAGAQNPQFDGRTQVELDYLEYLRAEQLENDGKIKDSAAENARLSDQSPHLEGLVQDAVAQIFQTGGRTQAELDYLEYLRAEQLEDDAKVKDSAAENTRLGEAEITEEPNSDEPVCHSCHLFEKKVEKPVEIQPKTTQPESECLSCHLFDKPASTRPHPEVDTRKLASDESEGGYQQGTLNLITGIFQGEGTGRNLAPVNPKFGNANLEHPAKDGARTNLGSNTKSENPALGRFDDHTQDSLNQVDDELDYFEYRHTQNHSPDSSSTRLGGQREDKSATATRFGGQRQDQPASANARQSGPKQNWPASDNLRFRGQIRDQSASANIRFGGPAQDQSATANTRFGGQKQDQFASSNTRFGGQIQHQPISANTRFGDQSTSGFGDDSDLGGSDIDQPQKIDAELSFEAEAVQLRAAQKAFVAQVGNQQQGKLQTSGGGRKIKLSKLMDVDESLEVPRSTAGHEDIADRIVDNAGRAVDNAGRAVNDAGRAINNAGTVHNAGRTAPAPRKIIQVSKLMDEDEVKTFSGSSLDRPRVCRSCFLFDV